MTKTDPLQPDTCNASAQVLLVEDEQKTRDSIAEGFGLEQWTVHPTSNGEEALMLLDKLHIDLVILDWMLPGCDGPDVLKRLRARGNTVPVLMLTARSSVEERVRGLETGADDYLTKPFAFAELLARSRALLRRTSTAAPLFLSCGDLSLDVRRRIAMRDTSEIQLTPREVDILEYLLRLQGQVVSREMLEQDVWHESRRFTSLDNVIDVQMMRLRKKIDDGTSKRLIHTIRGIGYILGEQSP